MKSLGPYSKIESLLPKDEHLRDFSKIFLDSMSPGMVSSFDDNELVNFLKGRFQFFKESIKVGGEFKVEVLPRDKKIMVDWSYPDAVYSMDSIENILKQMGAKVYRRVFRSLGVKSNEQGDITSVYFPKGKEKRNVIIYMELHPFSKEEMVEELSDKLRVNAYGMSQAIKDSGAVIEVLKGLAGQIKENTDLKEEEITQWVSFTKWMEENFFFMGYRAFEKGKDLPQTGLGVCSQTFGKEFSQSIIDALTFEVFKSKDILDPCYFGNIRASNPVRKSQGLMRVCIRSKNIEHNFLGFVRSVALNENILDVPVLGARIRELFEGLNIVWESYSFNKILKMLSLIPKTDLFKTPVEELQNLAKTLMTVNLPNQVYCQFYQQKIKGRFSLFVVSPKDRFDVLNINKTVNFLAVKIPYPILEVVEVKGSDPALMHIHFEASDEQILLPDVERLGKEISDIIKPWEEAFEEFLVAEFGDGIGQRHGDFYLPLMPNHYKDRTYPEDAAKDMVFIEELAHKEGLAVDVTDFKRPGSKFHDTCSLMTIYSQEKIDLIKIMPILKNLGLYVFDQLVSRIGDQNRTAAYVGSFRVVDSEGKKIEDKGCRDLLGQMVIEVLQNRSEDDYINTLVLKAKLHFREINVLELYRNLYLQTRPAYDRHRITAALSKYPHGAATLIEYFKEKFSTDESKGDKEFRLKNTLPKIKERFLDILSDISVVAEDIILRNLFTLIEHTVRTNYFVPHKISETFMSVKILSQEVDFIPAPKPYREIYVHDSNMEGTHLRLGPIARGGIRWSDRGDDFRTEVLGLVSTQQKKNVVIVPTGSKGGFFIKRFPKAEDVGKESKIQYQRFIKSLLQITDNMDVSRKVFHPQNVLCYDDLDPYLVVAADKGTATFSDIANAISNEHKFWLGDGFASGGSAGYDHKKEAITARGAYECTKLHFKEKGKDIEKDTFSLAGIGDMAGDVFGNGMLLCKKGLLKAAFNHVHIFLDPNPDVLRSYEERKRLFNLPRSTWMDYDTKLIGQGGGIFFRSAKTINLTPEIKEMLQVKEDILTGEQITMAILKMPIELFWFGGIGTYIRASTETNLDVGDKANDNVRISASDMNAQVVSEGANLGVTQKARIELAKKGVHINSDAIDNSAGVNMSDYEVNIKILLNQLLNEKKINSMEERNRILASATDQVSDLVLKNNRGQHRMMSMDVIRSKTQFRLFRVVIDDLIENGLDANSENIPKRKELEQAAKAKKGLPRPLISALSAYVKMEVKDALVNSPLLKEEFYGSFFRSYFPKLILDQFGKEIDIHPLKKEIISTVVTNKIINQAGIHFFHRGVKIHAKSMDLIAHSYLINEAVLKGDEFRKNIMACDAPELSKYEALIEFDELLKHLTHFSLRLSSPLSVDRIPIYAKEIADFENLLVENKEESEKRLNSWKNKGFNDDLAKKLAVVDLFKEAADIFYFHEEKDVPFKTALKVSMAVNKKFQIWWFFKQVSQAEASSDWENELKDILILSLVNAKFRIVDLVLLYSQDVEDISLDEVLKPMLKEFKIGFKTFFETLAKIKEDPHAGLTALSVCINGLNFVGNVIEIKRKKK